MGIDGLEVLWMGLLIWLGEYCARVLSIMEGCGEERKLCSAAEG